MAAPLATLTAPPLAEKSNSWLITPNVGLTVWTLVVFAIALIILWRFVFPRIGQVLDERRQTIDGSIDAAQRTREEADKILAEYRERLTEARQQAEQIVQRARQTAEDHINQAKDEAEERRKQMIEQTRRDIESETSRAIDRIRSEVADLTVMATERVTRKTLDSDDQRRLVQDAISELDFATLSGGSGER